MKVMLVFGTRPEAIKMCPLIIQLKKQKTIECKVCLTGQHKEMLDQVMNTFKIVADYNLNIMKSEQTLTSITVEILTKFEVILQKEKPDIILVHGDTTTSLAASLAAFYQKIPVGHVEAGLRTHNKYLPFPEEMNRTLIGHIATLHFAPTILNMQNLLEENVRAEKIYITGNTVIDALKTTVSKKYIFRNYKLNEISLEEKKVILLTAHRRENIGQPLKNICNAVKRIAEDNDDICIVYPVHLNPLVRKIVYSILEGIDNVLLIDPLDIMDMHNLMSRSYFIMTDSGGLQEEGPACGKPVLVLRLETERPEAVEAGTAKLIGVEENVIYNQVKALLTNKYQYDKMAKAINPYGDGHASERIVEVLVNWKG